MRSTTKKRTTSDSTEPPRKRTRESLASETTQEKETSSANPSQPSKTTQKKENPTPNNQKWLSWSSYAHKSPFPNFPHPTPSEVVAAHKILERMHGASVREEFSNELTAEEYPYVLDALTVAAVSQATSWNNGKRALKSLETTYGSSFAYEEIVAGGVEKLEDALRPGGMQARKSKMLLGILKDVYDRYGKYDLNFLFDCSDDDAMKELLSYKGIGPKCAYCVMSMCLKRQAFAVDVHIYRVTGRWGWRPKEATKEEAQAHLDERIANECKLPLHFLFIQHGRQCQSCRRELQGNSKCEALAEILGQCSA